MSGSITIDIPIIIDTSAEVIVFNEDIDISDANFIFAPITGTNIDVSNLSNGLYYKDDNDGPEDRLFRIDTTNITEFAREVENNIFTPSQTYTLVGSTSTVYTPRNGTYVSDIAEHFVQYMASILFGHPLAQAPIKNEQAIENQIFSADFSGQIFNDFFADVSENDGVTDLSGVASKNGLILAIFEQIIANAPSRIGSSDLSFVPFPLYAGDNLRFLVRIRGTLTSDTSVYAGGGGFVGNVGDIELVFNHLIDPSNGNPTYSYRPLYKEGSDIIVKPKVWVITFDLSGTNVLGYQINNNVYTGIGTDLKFQVIGNQLHLDTSDPSFLPPGVEHFVFLRDISNYSLSLTDASYVSNVDVTYFDGGSEIDYSGTFIINARDNTLNDSSLVELHFDPSLVDIFDISNGVGDVDISRVYLVDNYRYTLRNGLYDLSSNETTISDLSDIFVDGPFIDFSNTALKGVEDPFILIYNSTQSTTTEAHYDGSYSLTYYSINADSSGTVTLNGNIMNVITSGGPAIDTDMSINYNT